MESFCKTMIWNGTNRDFKKWKYGASLRCFPAPKRRLSGTSRREITFGNIASLCGGTTCRGKATIMVKALYSAAQNLKIKLDRFVICAKFAGGSGSQRWRFYSAAQNTAPRGFYQLATVDTIAFGIAVHVASFLMTAKTQSLYQACLHRLVEICQQLTGTC